jgi:hypothetical protein
MSDAGDKILGSIREARAILRGESDGELVVHVPPELDVRGAELGAGAAAAPKARRAAC